MQTTLVKDQGCSTNQEVIDIAPALDPGHAPKKQHVAAPFHTFVSIQLLHLELYLCSQPTSEEPFPQLHHLCESQVNISCNPQVDGPLRIEDELK